VYLSHQVLYVPRSLLSAVEAHYKDPTHPYPGEDNSVIYELTPYLESAGIHDPLTKVGLLLLIVGIRYHHLQIYATLKPLKWLTNVMFVFILTQLTKLAYHKNAGKLCCLKAFITPYLKVFYDNQSSIGTQPFTWCKGLMKRACY